MKNHSLTSLPSAAKALFEFWLDARGADVLPHKSAIDPIRLRRWIGDLSVIELHQGEHQFWVRLCGTNLVNYIGTGFERRYLEERIPTALHAVALEPYHTAIAEKYPTYSIMRPGLLTGVFDQLERLILPFSGDEDGEVERFIVWASPSNRDRFECETVYGTGAGYIDVEQEKRASRLTILRPEPSAVEVDQGELKCQDTYAIPELVAKLALSKSLKV